jgi:glycosyltransferase involved in cell wall biosynthesis
MSKINILVNPSDRAGSGKYRCVDPHVALQNNHGDDYFVEINYNVNFDDINYLKKFQLFFFHRVPGNNFAEAVEIVKKIKAFGGKVIVDLDDHWNLDPSHGMYNQSKSLNFAGTIISVLKEADLVTVTTSILQKDVLKHNKNCVVLPNSVNPNEPQFKPATKESDKLRFGWLGGSSHIKDIELLKGVPQRAKEYADKVQFVLCGYDTRGKVRMFNKETNQWMEREMQPVETTWFMYEIFITDNFRLLEKYPDYLKHLLKFDAQLPYDDRNMPYRRIWTKSIETYAKGYNEFDVALAPLVETSFNKYKSQLKVIEAGFHKKAIIAQNYGPYTIDLISAIEKGGGFNNAGNSLLVESSKNHKQWSQHVKRLIDNPSLVEDLGEKLYETVKDKYNLNNVTKERAEIYKTLL